MCGIVGEISLSDKAVSTNRVTDMLMAIKHRGPDGQGVYSDKKVSLGMVRLAIIDVATGDQPLFNEDKSIVIVGNGEIYNYKELNKKLKKHKFKTGSDIETIVHLYEQRGINFLNELRGMFAFILYDKKKDLVVIARDRAGEKPVYLTHIDKTLYISSELKAIMTLPGVDKQLDISSIDNFFHFYFIPEPKTIFKHVKKLEKGHALIIDLKANTTTDYKYYDPLLDSFSADPSKLINETLDDSCKLTLRSDVPVGLSLSGGIDSGAILSLAAPAYKDTLKAFSVGYENRPPTDERKIAKELADKYKVEFFDIELKSSDFVKDFPQLIYDSDDPIADIASFSIYSVSKSARENNIKVLLGGLGGDELFFGYRWVSEAIKKSINNLEKIKDGHPLFFYDQISPYTQAEKFITPGYGPLLKGEIRGASIRYMESSDVKDDNQVILSSLRLLRDLWLTSNCVALSDRLSMANSVELRSPFLDHKLLELSLSSDKNLYSFEQNEKYYLKKAMRGILPKAVLDREKRGFTPPVGEWLRLVIDKYVHLLNVGFLSEQGIIDTQKLSFITYTWKAIPMFWYPIYQLILLEIYGRMFYYGVKPDEI